MSHEQFVFNITRPHPKLMVLYTVRSILSGPFIVFSLPVLYFRYHTMRYHFDEEGISMRWGILFRREVNLTYARIQDIHVTSGPLLRWLGLAELHIQTASGSATAEMTIEGIREFEILREFLYTRMRGYRKSTQKERKEIAAPAAAIPAGDNGELSALLTEIRDELRGAREALQALGKKEGDDV
jgi:putative membrane protein